MHRLYKSLCCVLVCLALASCGSKGFDQTDPVSVVEAIINAAKTKDLKHLASLCYANISYRGDAKAICEMNPKHRRWKSFVSYFSTGKVIGKPEITGDQATVRILFGPKGNKRLGMPLVRYQGKWYLSKRFK